jgi:protein gp37
MGANSLIPWCHHTWIGCTEVSLACDNCYARLMAHHYRWAEWGDHPRRRTAFSTWMKAYTLNRKAAQRGVRERVFTNSLSDFFDNQVPPEWRTEAWGVIRACTHLDWLILTKRPQNIRKMLPPDWGGGWPHVWLGTTVENMVEARRRIPVLLRVPAVCHWLSCEPLLGPLDLRRWLIDGGVDWVICGGESGHHRRVMEPEWARSLRDQCAAAGVAFFMKQMTSLHPKDNEIPDDLMVRLFPIGAE